MDDSEVTVPIEVEEEKEEEQLLYQDVAPVVLGFNQSAVPRKWCLSLTCSLWLDNASVLVILINCMFLSMYKPHDNATNLQVLDHFSIAFFLMEMAIKVLALGFYGYEGSYLSNSWNKWDFFLYSGEVLDYFLALCGIRLHLRFVLRLMRLILRVPGMQGLVVTLLDVLPMLSNVFMLYMFFLVVFGIMGVQLWEGDLRNRCFLGADIPNVSLSPYFVPVNGKGGAFICSRSNRGMRHCHDVPPYVQDGKMCLAAPNHGLAANACVNWNMYYNVCRPGDHNPYKGAISFDHTGLAMIAMFQTVTLEGWTDIMSLVMDAHSFGSLIIFILVTIMGYFIIMNVCAVVIATQFSKSMTRKTRVRTANPIGQLCIRFFRWLWTTTHRSKWVHQESNRGRKGGVLGKTFRPVVRAIERMINSRMFEWLIMFTVFLSILTMAVEHHEQPQQVAEMLHISNLVFTGIFGVELCLKLVALKWGYFKDSNNIVDFIIVVASLGEIGSKTTSRSSMLRMLRLLRFMRLLRFLPNLNRQLLVLFNTMKEGRQLYQLLIYVIFIFSVLGRTMFGGKFKFQTQDGQTINSRMNFDSLHWSMITVFQVMTEEDWNLVLYDAVAATSAWAFIYFLLIIMVGKHVLLNIMVGIVVKGFQTEHGPDEDGSSSPPSQIFESAHEPDGSSASGARSPRVTDPAPPQTNNTSLSWICRVLGWCREHEDWSFFVFSPQNRFRVLCQHLVSHKMFDFVILFFILLSCVTIAMERPSIDPAGTERWILKTSNYVFSAIFLVEMIFKVVALGLLYGKESYCRSIWNTVDGTLVILSLVSIIVPLASRSKTASLGIFKVFRLLRALRPLRLIKRAPKLRLAMEALIASFKPLGNITFICCTFFFFYGVLGVQLFKGTFYQCVGEDISNITNKSDCVSAGYRWERNTYNFDNLPQALLTLFVMYSKDGWVAVMFDGLDAVGVDQLPVRNHNKWMVLFFITFMVMSFFLFDMFIGVMVDTFHECQQKQKRQDEAEVGGRVSGDKPRSEERENTEEEPYYTNYSPFRQYIHSICISNALDHAINTIVTINIVVMALQHYGQPPWVEMLVESSFHVFTIILVMEILLKLTAFGIRRCTASLWNVLDIAVALISIVSISLKSMNMTAPPFNPGMLRVCRALKLVQVLKAKKIKLLLKTIIKTLSQVGNICVLFLFVFFIYAILGVELFGNLECSKEHPCLGLYGHFNFRHFGMALLTLYQVCTGDNWSGIMKDTLRKCRPGDISCLSYLSWASPIFFITFVMMAQFVLVNLVVGAIMQALEDSYEEDDQQQIEPSPESQEDS